jgi:arabinofuranosyltransferase
MGAIRCSGDAMTFVKRHADAFACSALVLITLAYAALFVDFNVPPFEDAAMLMRYADHLAHGAGIVWNIGEHPVDGATDFLFMASSAGLIRLGVPIGRSVRAIGFASHLLSVLLIYLANRRLWRAGVALSFLSSLYLAAGTGFSYVAAFFGTPFFALWATLTWVFALVIMRQDEARPWAMTAFAASGLITGLIRPEGVILAGLMLIGIVIAKGWRASLKTIGVFAAVFVVLGGAYFIWRWNYFGYPLPNPFYKKGGGLLHLDSFWESLGNLIRFAGPFALAFVLGLRSTRTRRLTIALLVPLVLFAAAFILVSNETNFGGRFQYALWPLVLISWYPLVQGLPQELGWTWKWPAETIGRVVWILAGLTVAYAIVAYAARQNCMLTSAQQSCGTAFEADGRYDVGTMLSEYKDKRYTIATSEAGLLPLYSNWRAIDAWGLNDEWIAHHGEITPEYLDEQKPELIVFHAYFSPVLPPKVNEKNLAQDWFRMTITLKDYAESHAYILAAALGDSPYETHYYYVRPDFADSAKIVHALATMKDYRWPVTGRKAVNYANFQQ